MLVVFLFLVYGGYSVAHTPRLEDGLQLDFNLDLPKERECCFDNDSFRSAPTLSLVRQNSFHSAPTSRVNTTERLQKIREIMKEGNIAAYIVPNSDDHQSEFVGVSDRRREYMTGFTGSNGDAVITIKSAALWTDSRYYLQAEQQTDCNWLLMGQGSLSIQEWLARELKPGDLVASDPKKVAVATWKAWDSYLKAYGVQLVMTENLVDEVWTTKPSYPTEPIAIHDLHYAGETWQSKLNNLRKEMAALSVQTFIITALDEIAWLLNLRGKDIPYSPVFRAYCLVAETWANLYIPTEKITPKIRNHLYSPEDRVLILPYELIWSDLENRTDKVSNILVPSSINYASGASYLIYKMLPHEKVVLHPSPIINMKAYKNDIEAEGMRNAHIRDAVALCQLIAMMEQGIADGEQWDELKVVYILDWLRAQQPLNRGASFQSIVAFGKNGALPHYIPTPKTNTVINNSSLLTIDSGGQYLDGTIDTTRVLHFGTPSKRHREVYTSLLQGCIDLVSTVFPVGTTLQQLEILIRRPLYHLGLNYGHGSTHGIGSFLDVHECKPPQIYYLLRMPTYAFNYTYGVNFFGSQEPGYYKENDFGMRLENIVSVVPTTEKYFLTFEPITLVPYEKKLIDLSTLERNQIAWLESYHAQIRSLVGDEMIRQGRHSLYKWLIHKTDPLI